MNGLVNLCTSTGYAETPGIADLRGSNSCIRTDRIYAGAGLTIGGDLQNLSFKRTKNLFNKGKNAYNKGHDFYVNNKEIIDEGIAYGKKANKAYNGGDLQNLWFERTKKALKKGEKAYTKGHDFYVNNKEIIDEGAAYGKKAYNAYNAKVIILV